MHGRRTNQTRLKISIKDVRKKEPSGEKSQRIYHISVIKAIRQGRFVMNNKIATDIKTFITRPQDEKSVIITEITSCIKMYMKLAGITFHARLLRTRDGDVLLVIIGNYAREKRRLF